MLSESDSWFVVSAPDVFLLALIIDLMPLRVKRQSLPHKGLDNKKPALRRVNVFKAGLPWS